MSEAPRICTVAIELSRSRWMIGALPPRSTKVAVSAVAGGDTGRLLVQLHQLQERLAREFEQPVESRICFEAGYDGFWLGRFLRDRGHDVYVLDASSFLISRRGRRTKTNRIDVAAMTFSAEVWIRALAALICSRQNARHHSAIGIADNIIGSFRFQTNSESWNTAGRSEMETEMTSNGTSPRRVLIAGGSSGMGFALARRLTEAGDHVAIVGRDAARLQRARGDLGGSPSLETYVADITSEAEVQALFANDERFDHIVCTAADFAGAYELLPALDLGAARRAIDSKILGPILLAKHGSPQLVAGGSLTFTSGIAAYRPMARGTVVATINAALEGLVRALAVELAPIRVNAVSPGWVDTPIWQAVAGERKAQVLAGMAERLPVGRVGQPEDIADAVAFLIGNGFTTGTVLHVEGGHRLV